MNQKANEAVNAAMGVVRQQISSFSVVERFDALDELNHRIADMLAKAKGQLSVAQGDPEEQHDPVPIEHAIDVASGSDISVLACGCVNTCQGHTEGSDTC